MPSGFSALDTGFPNLKGMKSTDDQLDAVESYLYQLIEQLRWTLNHLDQSNFNQTEVIGWLAGVIEEPIKIAIKNIEDGIDTRLTIDEGKINTLISKTGINSLGQTETLYSRIDQTAENITTTVAEATHQYDTGSYVMDYAGYGAPTGTAASGKKYLDQETGDWYTSNGSSWSKSGTFPLLTSATSLVSTINQGAGYINSSVVKVEDDGHGTITSLGTWKTQTDTDITNRVTATDMQTALTQTAGDIMLDVRGQYADEWDVTTPQYYENDVVKVTARDANNKVIAVSFYKATEDHVPAQGNKPPSSKWTAISSANVQSVIDANLSGITLSYDYSGITSSDHNAAKIKLNKDGVEIAGQVVKMTNVVADSIAAENVQAGTLDAGVLYSGTISADNITAGTLEAGDITVDGEFTVQRTVQGSPLSCGWLGGGVAKLPDYYNTYADAVALGSDDNLAVYAAVSNGVIQDNVKSGSAMLRNRDAVVYCNASFFQHQTAGGTFTDVHPYCMMETLEGDHFLGATYQDIRCSEQFYVVSDRRKKKDIDYDMSRYDKLFRSLKPCSYRLKTETDTQEHTGFIAQDVDEILQENGLDNSAFVGRLYDLEGYSNDDPLLALRYGEFTALNTHMIQKLMERVDALEKKLEGSNAP